MNAKTFLRTLMARSPHGKSSTASGYSRAAWRRRSSALRWAALAGPRSSRMVGRYANSVTPLLYRRPMAKVKTVHRCTECGGSSPRWTGRCPACEAWNTLVEEREVPPSWSARGGEGLAGGLGAPAVATPITAVDGAGAQPVPTGLPELDRVLGGGLVPGSGT